MSKIFNELPAAATLTGTEVIPLNQTGTTCYVSTSDLGTYVRTGFSNVTPTNGVTTGVDGELRFTSTGIYRCSGGTTWSSILWGV